MTDREQEVNDRLQIIAKTIDTLLPKGFGFTLLAYEFNENGKLLYVSNSDRESVVKAMEEFIEKTRGENYGKHIE